ncbi:MAG: hypothetical protein OXU20_02470 [Myxococcales bacterium]|nr:hypothetical protein [Myxococcales bacterium]
MAPADSNARATLQLSRGVLLATLPTHLTAAGLQRLRADVLQRAPDAAIRGVVLDASTVEIMDASDYQSLSETLRMCMIMGRPSLMCGLTPGVVSSLVELDIDPDALVAVRDVEAALDFLRGGSA